MSFQRISRKSVPLALLPVLAAGGLLLLVPEPTPLPAPVAAPRPVDRVLLGDGRELRGEVLREGAAHVVVRTVDGRHTLVEKDRVEQVLRRRELHGPWRRVRLRNGKVLRGQLLAEGPESLELRLEAGTRVTVRRADVASIASGR